MVNLFLLGGWITHVYQSYKVFLKICLNNFYLQFLSCAKDVFLKLSFNTDAASLGIKNEMTLSTLEIPSSVNSQVIYIVGNGQ